MEEYLLKKYKILLNNKMNCFNFWVGLISIVANICIVAITIITFWVNIVSKKITIVSAKYNSKVFEGDSLVFCLENKTFHTIAINTLILMVKNGDSWFTYKLLDLEEPLLLGAREVRNLSSKQFTKIVDRALTSIDLASNWVIAVESGNQIIWCTDFGNKLLREAKRAYKNNAYLKNTIYQNIFNGVVLSQNVAYIVQYLSKDINSNFSIETVYVLYNGLMDKTIMGINCLASNGKVTKNDINDFFHAKLHVAVNNYTIIDPTKN